MLVSFFLPSFHPWHKYSHHGWFQVTNMMSLNVDLGGNLHYSSCELMLAELRAALPTTHKNQPRTAPRTLRPRSSPVIVMRILEGKYHLRIWHRWGRWDWEGLSNLPKVKQLVSRGARTQAWAFRLQIRGSCHLRTVHSLWDGCTRPAPVSFSDKIPGPEPLFFNLIGRNSNPGPAFYIDAPRIKWDNADKSALQSTSILQR